MANGVLEWFLLFLKKIRVDILEKFQLPGLKISYWTFVISLAIVSLIVVALVNKVALSSADRAGSSLSPKPKRGKDK